MPKSRQNLSSLLSIVFYIFLDLFLVVHSREISYFRKEKQFSTQNSVFLELSSLGRSARIWPRFNVIMV